MTTATDTPTIRSFWQTFRRSKMGMVGAFMLISAILMAVFAPQLAPYDPKEHSTSTSADVESVPDCCGTASQNRESNSARTSSILPARDIRPIRAISSCSDDASPAANVSGSSEAVAVESRLTTKQAR
jgi:ABC-type dipeptide/oligopeptide/nickel transport system permease subunit